MKTNLEKGRAAGYQKEAQVSVVIAVECVPVLLSYQVASVLTTEALKPLCPPLHVHPHLWFKFFNFGALPNFLHYIQNMLEYGFLQFWHPLLLLVPVISGLYTSGLTKNVSKLFLKLFTESELTTCDGKLFHIFIVLFILWVKIYLEKSFTKFVGIPLVTESWHIGKLGETAVS